MTIYIDNLFMINFFTDSVLLFFVQLFAKRNVRCTKIMLGAVVMAFYSLGSVFEGISFLYGMIPKVFVCCLTLLFVFGKTGYIKTLMIFWAATLLLGGTVYAVSTVKSPYDYIIAQNNAPNDVTPFISLIGCLMLYAMLYLMKRITVRNLSRERMIIDTDVRYLNKSYRLKALIDTGCCLCEPLSGDAVIIADQSIFSDIPHTNCEIGISTAAGKKTLPLIFPEKTIGENKMYRIKSPIPIALTPNKLNTDGLYDAIINPDATENITDKRRTLDILSDINILKNNKTSERKINNDTHQKI